MKKKIAYMLAVTSDYVFAAGNVVLSLIRHRPEKDFDVVIFYEDMCESDKRIFESIGVCHLRQYSCPEGFKDIISKNCPKFTDSNFAKHFSFLKFAKFEIFTLLEEYENAVWLDVDISIQDDLSSIISYGPFAITQDKPWTVQRNFTQPIPNYDMEKDGVCSAVFLVSDNLKNYGEMKDWCYSMAKECSPYFRNIDQGIINLLIQHFEINFNYLPLYEWQCITFRDEAIYAKIVHFGTPKKIWNTSEIVSAFPEWYRIHLKWLDRGGSDFIKPDGWKIRNAYTVFREKNKDQKKMQSIKALNNLDYKLCMFGIPLWKRKIKGNRVKYYLFGVIHLFTIKHIGK